MILDIKRYTQEEYDKFKSDNFYYKDNPPEIEVELQELQRRLLVDQDLNVLPEFKDKLKVYLKSHLLARLKGTSDYIDPLEVETMSEEAAVNFLKRYFRNSNPIVGASFSGIGHFKVTEVLSEFFKGRGVSSVVSLDDVYVGKDGDENLTKETLLSYKEYLKEKADEDGDYNQEEIFLENLERECALLRQVEEVKNADLLFLEFLIYICILQGERKDKKLTVVLNIAEKILNKGKTDPFELNSLMESAFLDIKF